VEEHDGSRPSYQSQGSKYARRRTVRRPGSHSSSSADRLTCPVWLAAGFDLLASLVTSLISRIHHLADSAQYFGLATLATGKYFPCQASRRNGQPNKGPERLSSLVQAVFGRLDGQLSGP
jgi:hypothetical protein